MNTNQHPHLIVVGGPQTSQIQPQNHARIPPRVQTAMEFLRRLDEKTATIPMPTYSSDRVEYNPIEGQKLCAAEEATQVMACNLLEQYFSGKLPECIWDKPEQVDPASNLTRLVIRCPRCGGGIHAVQSDCDICGGMGEVLIARANTPLRKGRKP